MNRLCPAIVQYAACLTLLTLLISPTLRADDRANLADDDSGRPRLLVLTDIGGDPDDQQSMIRLLVHANEFEIEGLIATASGTPGELKEAVTKPHLIREQIEAYAQVLPNLRIHADEFPSTESLLGVVKSGNPNRGRDFIGAEQDTEGSRWCSCAPTRWAAAPTPASRPWRTA